jgi:hypothetical protein
VGAASSRYTEETVAVRLNLSAYVTGLVVLLRVRLAMVPLVRRVRR